MSRRARGPCSSSSARELGPDDTALIAAHDAVNRVLLCRVLGLPLERVWSFRQAPASLNVLAGPVARRAPGRAAQRQRARRAAAPRSETHARLALQPHAQRIVPCSPDVAVRDRAWVWSTACAHGLMSGLGSGVVGGALFGVRSDVRSCSHQARQVRRRCGRSTSPKASSLDAAGEPRRRRWLALPDEATPRVRAAQAQRRREAPRRSRSRDITEVRPGRGQARAPLRGRHERARRIRSSSSIATVARGVHAAASTVKTALTIGSKCFGIDRRGSRASTLCTSRIECREVLIERFVDGSAHFQSSKCVAIHDRRLAEQRIKRHV